MNLHSIPLWRMKVRRIDQEPRVTFAKIKML
jgi:hypothetical protein